MIFAPAPQLTITIEQRGDRPDIHLHAGGQGIWQARMVRALGVPVVLCAALGGETGRVLEPLLADEGIDLRAVRGESRSGGYVHDRRGGSRVNIVDAPGEPLTRHELDELYGLALAEGLRAEVSVLSGPANNEVRADPYRRLAHDLTRNGRRVLADLSGDRLSAALQGGLAFLKVSHEELVVDGRVADDSEEEMLRAMRALHDAGAESIVVSRADRPALALLDDEMIYELIMPKLEAADPRGAGDSMTAGVAAVLAGGGDLKTAVRTGAAAGAINVTRHGLGTGRADGILALVERVELVPAAEERGDGHRHEITSPEDLATRTKPR